MSQLKVAHLLAKCATFKGLQKRGAAWQRLPQPPRQLGWRGGMLRTVHHMVRCTAVT